ncbi:MAG: exosortase C-terminal domain/associated protein EpsI [Terriglobia bacterium]
MNERRRSWVRGIYPVVLLLLAAIFLHRYAQAEVLPPHQDVTSFPSRLGPWEGTTLTIPAGDLAILGPGEFVERTYRDGAKPMVDLFLAYFPSQRTGDTIHSPKHCLPGSGWTPVETSVISIPWEHGKVVRANYYVLQLGSSREIVIYWFQSQGRTEASEYWAKLYLLADALRTNRTDGALIRVITPVGEGESLEGGKKRAVTFTRLVLPLLGRYIPG